MDLIGDASEALDDLINQIVAKADSTISASAGSGGGSGSSSSSGAGASASAISANNRARGKLTRP